ncbi:helix-turn-helix domain-containing protein [Paracoccus mangrovi]|uniref:ArsR family transcriptional regulator n=5 Tax=Paracoccaceae TaxID=31989 RepID=A0A2H5F1Y1_9RHOB|nr:MULTISPECIES: helix-turn-helix domain-containing protein [Paracoccaceae]TKW64810.1 MAG: ArsR family transcriptional regulator [Paracoccus denitrificans]AUH65561.1 ArsR family transcriptional regulator [Paracoccus zhejiangensis]OWJ83296.1 ArsR family transcriptional regulator [Haematobacter missouriensis]TRW92947.1 helix-turn-helix domain-containing protein [Paracoccus sp. M683]WJS86409.1 helix-turn-helix domain-containing protein [Paracoccus sp. TOH]
MEKEIPDQLSTLGHPQRLAIFRLLMRRYPDRVPAGEIASTLGVKASTMSTYLSALTRDQLVEQQRAGTSLLYAINMTTVQRLFGYLFSDCCRGRPDICMPFSTGTTPMSGRKYNVLFICVGNSARSIFAESLLRSAAGDRFIAYSAGTRPGTQLNPFAVQVLQDKGHDVSVLRSKDVSEFARPDAPQFDFVFTVCDQAANEECPAWEGQPVSGHWGMPDPVKVEGTNAEKALAFQQAYGALKHRIEAFVALPIETLDRIALQKAVDDIGRASPETLA